MDIQFYGANAVRLSTKKASILIDDNLSDLGQKSVSKAGDIAIFTMSSHGSPKAEAKVILDQPGEYEVSNTSIQGIPARAHIDEPGQHTATMFKVVADDIRVAIVGHIYPELTDKQLEDFGMIDILIIPVGGNGYTLDGIGALKVIKKIDPKVIIPTHYDQPGLQFPVPQQPLADALKGLAMEPKEPVEKLKVKSGEFGEGTQLVVLQKP